MEAQSADENGWYRYDEIADLLIPYLHENGFTHVEFLPLSEHPFDGSWGYQNTGFFCSDLALWHARTAQNAD